MKSAKKFDLVSVVFISICLGTVVMGASFRVPTRQEKSPEVQDRLKKLKSEWQERKDRLKVEDLTIENRTQALIITNIEKKDNLFIVTLRNDSQKTITGYEVSIGKAVHQSESLAGVDPHNVLLPGETRQKIYPVQVDVDKLGIKILAVVFDDKTEEGDPKYIQEIRDYRLGMRMQHEHMLRLLQGTLSLSGEAMASVLERMKSQLSPITKEEEENLPPIVGSALNGERDRALHVIDEIISPAPVEPQAGRPINERNLQKEKLQEWIDFYSSTLKRL